MTKDKTAKLSVLAVVSEVIAFVFAYITSSFFPDNCSYTYLSTVPTAIFALVGVGLSLAALVLAIKSNKLIRAARMVVIVMLIAVAAYFAYFVASFQVCF